MQQTPSSQNIFLRQRNTQHTGVGIIKAWKSPKGYKYVHVRGKVNTAPSIQGLHDQINGRLYDIRVMMMRDGKRKWQYAGMIAKVSLK